MGDVLLANSLHDFSISAAIEDEKPQIRPAGGSVHPAVARLLAYIPAWRDRFGQWNHDGQLGCCKPQVTVPDDIHAACYYGSDTTRETVRNSLQRHFPTTGRIRRPLYKTGAVATANVLLKDTQLLDQWLKSARHITHIEMEAGGVYIAARNAQPYEIPLLCVRGISDIVGFKRSPEWTQFACEVAASFLHAMVSILPLEVFQGLQRTSAIRFQNILSSFPVAIQRAFNVTVDIVTVCFEQVLEFIERKNVKAPTLEAITSAFHRSSSPLLSRIVPPDDRIPRAELQTLEQFVTKRDSRVLCVLGTPGSGKTALLALFAKNAIDSGAVTLAIRADVLPSDLAFEKWGQREIGLDITALDAVKVASSRTNVLVIVDQLDALASTVDLTSDRLNAVIDFVDRCSSLPRVSIICSCRKFEFYNDTRFSSLNADVIELTLPQWGDVAHQLTRHRIVDSDAWPESFKELLRTPQHLQIFLDRFDSTGSANPFDSYQLMLDDFWARTIVTSAERNLVYQLTDYLVQKELLWAPLVLFEEQLDVIRILESKQILQSQDQRIGFRHQTLLEHAKARLFTKMDKSLCSHVLERQDAILVRPTVWAVLRYLRGADRAKYRTEIDNLFGAELRLHIRYLLIEFLGQVSGPEDYEISLLGQRLLTQEDRLRVLIAIRGSADWFYAFQSSCFPVVMRGPKEIQWAMIGVITDAWDFDRDSCIALIEAHWLPDPTKDELTWRAMREIGKWDERSVEIVCTLIRRAPNSGERLYWAESIVYSISPDQPTLAPRVFLEIVSRGGFHE